MLAGATPRGFAVWQAFAALTSLGAQISLRRSRLRRAGA
jgi:hypothetical protein